MMSYSFSEWSQLYWNKKGEYVEEAVILIVKNNKILSLRHNTLKSSLVELYQ